MRDEYIHAISSLLNNGECSSDLFSIEEMNSIYHAIGSNIKREYPNMVLDPKKMFTTRIKRNLHVCIALESTSHAFQLIVRHYASIIANCHVYWIRDWTEESLLIDAKHFMRDRLDNDELRNAIAKCMCDMHVFLLNECHQIPWAGGNEREITYQQTKIVEKKKEQIQKTISLNIPNWPYSKNLLHDLIKSRHVDKSAKSKTQFFLSSSTFLAFMNSFWYFFTTKSKQCENDIFRLRRVLERLVQTRDGSKQMRAYIKDLRLRAKNAEVESETLLRSLIEKTTSVEKLKASLGLAGSLATLMQMQEDNDINAANSFEEGNHLLDAHGSKHDEYDNEFTRMKDEDQKNKEAKILDELDKYNQTVEDLKRTLVEKRKNVRERSTRICQCFFHAIIFSIIN